MTLTRAVLVEGWKEQTRGKDTVTVWRTLSRLFFFFFWKGEWRVRQQLRGIQGQEMITLSELIYSLSVSPHTAP